MRILFASSCSCIDSQTQLSFAAPRQTFASEGGCKTEHLLLPTKINALALLLVIVHLLRAQGEQDDSETRDRRLFGRVTLLPGGTRFRIAPMVQRGVL